MKQARWVVAFFAAFVFIEAHAMILPKHHRLRDLGEEYSNINEEQFNKTIDYITGLWGTLAEIHGAKLVVLKDWNDPTVNAYAQQNGSEWSVRFFGGLARRPELSLDGFALIICHELGHHFGGYYFYARGSTWAASEGQADYWATQVCAQRVFRSGSIEKLKRIWRRHAREKSLIQERCNQVWHEPPLQALCYRTAEAGLSLAKLFAAAGGGHVQPNLNTPDPTKVPQTITYHPNPQCRLDTYLAGAVCTQKHDLRVIPGKGFLTGQNSREAEIFSAQQTCHGASGFDVGVRPECWFKSLFSGLVNGERVLQ